MKQKLLSLLALFMTVMTASAKVEGYDLTVGTTDKGTIKFKVGDNDDAKKAAEGQTVIVTITPYVGWTVNAPAGEWYAAIAASRGQLRSQDPSINLEQDFDLELVSENNVTGVKIYQFTMIRANAEISCTYKKDFSNENIIVVDIPDQEYQIGGLTPTVTVKDGDTPLVEGRDYTVSYVDNDHVGWAKVTVTAVGNNPNYSGTISKDFYIPQRPITRQEIQPTIAEATYDGQPQTPAVTVYDGNTPLVEGTDFTVSYDNNTEAGQGTASVTITGIGNYCGETTLPFDIKKADGLIVFRPWQFTKTYGDANFTITPVVRGTGTVVYSSVDESVATIDATTGEVTIHGVGKATIWANLSSDDNYNADRDWYVVTVLPKTLKKLTAEAIAAQTYTGEALEPAVTVKDGSAVLEPGVDYTVAYKDNTLPGTATVTITGTGNYTGSLTVQFTIEKADVVLTAPTAVAKLVYNGEEQILISAGEAQGGELQYSLNGENYSGDLPAVTDAGDYTVYYKVVGDANHNDAEARQLTVSIAPATLTSATLKADAFQFTGQAQTAEVAAVTAGNLEVPEDGYDVADNVQTNVGRYEAVVTGKGNFTGSVKVPFVIGEVTVYNEAMAALSQLKNQAGSAAAGAGQKNLTAGAQAALEQNRQAIDDMIGALEEQLNQDRAQGLCDDNADSYKQKLGEITEAVAAFGQRIEDFPEMGDGNGDGIVDLEDYLIMGWMVLGTRPMATGDLLLALDLTGDGTIGIGDLTGEVNLWMGRQWNDSGNAARSMGSLQEWLSVTTGSQIDVALKSERQYAAFVMDVVLPEGMQLTGARLSGRALGSHELRMLTREDGTVRLLASSVTNDVFAGTDGVLVSLDVTTTAAYRGGKAEVRNAVFATPETAEYAIAEAGTTGIAAAPAAVSGSPADTVYGLDGRLQPAMKAGVGIVRRADGTAVKVIRR